MTKNQLSSLIKERDALRDKIKALTIKIKEIRAEQLRAKRAIKNLPSIAYQKKMEDFAVRRAVIAEMVDAGNSFAEVGRRVGISGPRVKDIHWQYHNNDKCKG